MKEKIDYKKLAEKRFKRLKELAKEFRFLRDDFNSYLGSVAEDVITLLKDEKDRKKIKILLGLLGKVKNEVFEDWLKNNMFSERQTLWKAFDFVTKNKAVGSVALK